MDPTKKTYAKVGCYDNWWDTYFVWLCTMAFPPFFSSVHRFQISLEHNCWYFRHIYFMFPRIMGFKNFCSFDSHFSIFSGNFPALPRVHFNEFDCTNSGLIASFGSAFNRSPGILTSSFLEYQSFLYHFGEFTNGEWLKKGE